MSHTAQQRLHNQILVFAIAGRKRYKLLIPSRSDSCFIEGRCPHLLKIRQPLFFHKVSAVGSGIALMADLT